MPTSAGISRTASSPFLQIKCRTRLTESSFLLVNGRRDCGSPSTEVRLSLHLLKDSNMTVRLKEVFNV